MKQMRYPVERIIQILSEAELPVSSIYYCCIKVKQDRALADIIRNVAFKYTFYGYRLFML
jgi:hypothetical protein